MLKATINLIVLSLLLCDSTTNSISAPVSLRGLKPDGSGGDDGLRMDGSPGDSCGYKEQGWCMQTHECNGKRTCGSSGMCEGESGCGSGGSASGGSASAGGNASGGSAAGGNASGGSAAGGTTSGGTAAGTLQPEHTLIDYPTDGAVGSNTTASGEPKNCKECKMIDGKVQCGIPIAGCTVGEGTAAEGTETCSGNCADYKGKQNKTVNGNTCQRWDSQSPHAHDVGLGAGHNYCRNPDGESTIWCYTTDPKTEWELCKPLPNADIAAAEKAAADKAAAEKAAAAAKTSTSWAQNQGFACAGKPKEMVNQSGGRMNSNSCITQCKELSYFESGLDMCCQWDGEKCQLHYGFEAKRGDATTTFSFVKDKRSVSNEKGKVDKSIKKIVTWEAENCPVVGGETDWDNCDWNKPYYYIENGKKVF